MSSFSAIATCQILACADSTTDEQTVQGFILATFMPPTCTSDLSSFNRYQSCRRHIPITPQQPGTARVGKTGSLRSFLSTHAISELISSTLQYLLCETRRT